jgi:hypothetical protein
MPIIRSQIAFALGLENGEPSTARPNARIEHVQVPREDAVPFMNQIPVSIGVRDHFS